MTQIEEEEAKREVNWIDDLIVRFDAIEVETDNLLDQLREKKPAVVEKIENTESSDKKMRELREPNYLQLERLKLEKFNGEVRKYPTFKESFNLYVVPMCPKSQLPFILRSHLEPNVREEVENVEDVMNLLWERLDSKYGNHSKYVDVILSDLARTTKGDSKAALHLINTVEKEKRDLERIGAGQEMSNSTIIAMIEKKLPEEMRFDWIKTVSLRAGEDSGYKFRLLLEFLQRWRQMIEYDEAAIRKVTEKKTGSVNFAGATRGRKSESCWIHKDNGEHPIWRCRIFQAKSLKDRLELVNQKGACHACLEIDCEGAKKPKDCKLQFKCLVEGCGKFHNVLLHA